MVYIKFNPPPPPNCHTPSNFQPPPTPNFQPPPHPTQLLPLLTTFYSLNNLTCSSSYNVVLISVLAGPSVHERPTWWQGALQRKPRGAVQGQTAPPAAPSPWQRGALLQRPQRWREKWTATVQRQEEERSPGQGKCPSCPCKHHLYIVSTGKTVGRSHRCCWVRGETVPLVVQRTSYELQPPNDWSRCRKLLLSWSFSFSVSILHSPLTVYLQLILDHVTRAGHSQRSLLQVT